MDSNTPVRYDTYTCQRVSYLYDNKRADVRFLQYVVTANVAPVVEVLVQVVIRIRGLPEVNTPVTEQHVCFVGRRGERSTRKHPTTSPVPSAGPTNIKYRQRPRSPV